MTSRARKLLESVYKRVVLSTTEDGSVSVGDESPFALVQLVGDRVEVTFLDKRGSGSSVEATGPNYGVPLVGGSPFYVSLPAKTKKLSVEIEDGKDPTLWFDFEAKRQRMNLVKDLPTYFDAVLSSDVDGMKEGETTKWKDISTPSNREVGVRVFKVSGSGVAAISFSSGTEEFKHVIV